MTTRFNFYQSAKPEIWTVRTDFLESYSNIIKHTNLPSSFGYVTYGL